MGVSLSGGRDSGGRINGGGYLRLPPPEHSRTVYCKQDHYGPVSWGRDADGVKGGQVVVESVQLGLGGNANIDLRGGTDGGGGGDWWEGNGNELNWWEDNVENLILGTDLNDPLADAPGLEPHRPITSTLGGHRGRLDRDSGKFVSGPKGQ